MVQSDMAVDSDGSSEEIPEAEGDKTNVEMSETEGYESSVEMPEAEGDAHDEGNQTRGSSSENTIFIGNWPNEAGSKELKQMFKIYGKIISMRFRCAVRQDLKIPKKLAVIKKQFHSDVSSINAYIQFSNRKSCESALKRNGFLFHNHHLRVTMAKNQIQPQDAKKAVFVGNLSFKIQDNDLWNSFEDCGAIESVRVVRDSKTGIGKGFGYVNFKSADSVELALRLNGVEILNREVRVSRAENNVMPLRSNKMQGKKVSMPKLIKYLNNNVSQKKNIEKKEKLKAKPYFQGQKTKPSIQKRHKKKRKLDKKKLVIKQIAEEMKSKKK